MVEVLPFPARPRYGQNPIMEEVEREKLRNIERAQKLRELEDEFQQEQTGET